MQTKTEGEGETQAKGKARITIVHLLLATSCAQIDEHNNKWRLEAAKHITQYNSSYYSQQHAYRG